MYMIDTNIFVDFLRGRNPNIYEMFQNSDASMFSVSSVVRAELLLGAEKSLDPSKERARVERLLFPFEEHPFDSKCAFQYARIRNHLEESGKKIGANDYLIAATALAHSAVLVTNNADEFKRVPGLSIETWAEVPF